MDPITALGVATTAFNTIKKGFDVGRNAESMMSDVGRWMCYSLAHQGRFPYPSRPAMTTDESCWA